MTTPKPKKPQASQDMPNFDMPEDFDAAMVQPNMGNGIQLPFETPVLIWYNGTPAYKVAAANDPIYLPLYTGGWNQYVDNYEKSASVYGVNPAMTLFEEVPFKNGAKDAYLAQYIHGALIGQRMRWLTNEKTGKKFSHLQVLLYGAYIVFDGVLTPYAPIMLTAKGWATKYIQDALNVFSTKTMSTRTAIGKASNRAPLNVKAFYMPIGRFGVKRETVSAGQSDIVPCQTTLPEEVTPDWLAQFYVGREVAAHMVELMNDAREWLTDEKWLKAEDEAPRQDEAPAFGAPPSHQYNETLAGGGAYDFEEIDFDD